MNSSNNDEMEANQPSLSPATERGLAGLRSDFCTVQSDAMTSVMHRVRQEAELRGRMGATVREPTSRVVWPMYQRLGLAAAACAVVLLSGLAGLDRFDRPASSSQAMIQASPRSQITDSSSFQAPVAVRIAEAQPGDTVMLAQGTTIEAVDGLLRFSKQVRIEVAAPFRNQ